MRLSQTRTVSGGGGVSPSMHDVEMGVEGGDLVDLDQRQLHLLGQRRQMPRMEATVLVLEQMQEFDQQIAPARPVAEQRPHLRQRLRDRPGGPWACCGRRAAPSRDGCSA